MYLLKNSLFSVFCNKLLQSYVLIFISCCLLDTLSFSFIQLMALKSCHDRNVTHRDIKPGENIAVFSSMAIQFIFIYFVTNSLCISHLETDEGVGENERENFLL